MKTGKVKSKLGVVNISVLIILIVYCLTMITLLFWGFISSLKTLDDFDYNPVFFPKERWAWDNYVVAFQNFIVTSTNQQGEKIQTDVFGMALNSLLFAGGSALLETFSMCVVGYMACKYPFKFSKIVYTFVVITMVIPVIGSTPSMLLFLRSLKLYDTFFGVWLMKFHFLGMYFLVFYGVFKGISNEFTEAAIIDGASQLTVMFRIIFPLVIPTFTTICLILFIGYWNDYTTALLYMPSHPTLAYGVYKKSFRDFDGVSASTPMRITYCMMLAIPILTIFVLLRNKIMGNVTMGGVKE